MPATKITERGIRRRVVHAVQTGSRASWVVAMADDFDSDQNAENYPYIGGVRPMEEWDRERSFDMPQKFELELRNVKYSTAMEIPVDLIEDDKSGQVDRIVDKIASKANSHWAKLGAALLEAGETAVIQEDGKTFFATDHEIGASGSQSNDYTYEIAGADTSAPTPAEMADLILENIEQQLGLKDNAGEFMNEDAKEFIVLGPHTLMSPIGQAIGSELLPNPSGTGVQTSPLTPFNDFRLRWAVTPRLSWTNKIVVARTDAISKPFITQEHTRSRRRVEVLSDGSYVMKNDAWLVGLKRRRAMGYGTWQHIAMTTITT